MFFVFSYVWSGFIVLLGIFLNVYSKNEAKINAWVIKHGAKYSTYLSHRRQKRTTLMENVWCPIFKMASVFFLSETKSICLAVRIIIEKSQTQSLSRTDWSGELTEADTSLSWRLSISKTCWIKQSLHFTTAYTFQKWTHLFMPDFSRKWTHLKSRNLPKSMAPCLK